MRFLQSRYVLSLATFGLIAGCGSDPEPTPTRLTSSVKVQDFGDVPHDAPTTAKIAIRNSSITPMKSTPLFALEAPGSDLTASSTCTHALGANEACEITLTYVPADKSSREAKLVVFDDGVDGETLDTWSRLGQPSRAARGVDLVIPVTGKGGRRDRLSATPSSLSWGMLTSAAPEPKQITLTSTGPEPVSTAGGIVDFYDAEVEWHGCPETLAPKESCTLTVTPQPSKTTATAIDLRFAGATVGVSIAGAAESAVQNAFVLPPPTDATLRGTMWGNRALYVYGDAGSVFARNLADGTRAASWTRLVSRTSEEITAISTFGWDDSTSGTTSYTYRDDERSLVFAATSGGAILVSRKGGAFEPMAGTLAGRIASLSASVTDGANNEVRRPIVTALYADGRYITSRALGAFVADGASTNPVTWHSKYCAQETGYLGVVVNDDGTASAFTQDSNGQTTQTFPVAATGIKEAACNYVTHEIALVGEKGLLLTSTDGATWTPHASGTSETLRSVDTASVGNVLGFLAVGDHGTIVRWSAKSSVTSVKSHTHENLTSTNGYMIVGEHGTVLEARN